MKSVKFFLVFMGLSIQAFGQHADNKWTVSSAVAFAKYSDTDAQVVGERYTFQIPQLNVSRYLYNGVTLDVGLSIGLFKEVPGFFSNSVQYTSFDLGARYDFRNSRKNLVPYVYAGTSFISANSEVTPTVNIGGGAIFWLLPRFGLQPQLSYKSTLKTALSMRSHVYFSMGLVYSLKSRTLVSRLWNDRN